MPRKILSSTNENGFDGSRETSQSESLHISTAIAVDVRAVEAVRDHLADGAVAEVAGVADVGVGDALLDPGLDEPVGQVAGGGHQEGARAGGDVGDLEVEDRRSWT